MDVLNRPDVNAARTRGGAGRNPAAAWLAWALAAVIPQAPALTVNELVDCRTQVEDVYWRHRIWPESNTTPKPPLAAVLPREAIAAQVETMLGKAAALKERWHRPITSTAMQAELERMARDSQAPEVLNELFAAAGTGERAALCLALPELVDRWIEGSYAWDRRLHRDAAASATAAVAAIDDLEWEAADGAMISDRTYVRRTDLDPSPDPGWEAGKPTALDPAAWDDLTARLFPAAGSMAKARLVPWTPAGSPIDAGFKQPDGRVLEETADGFLVREVREAEADRIRVVSAHWAKEPLARWWQREAKRFAVKVPDATGIVMPLVSAPACTDGTWTPTRAGYVPSARSSHTAVWTGSEMIVWGGEDSFNRLTSTGGRYNPATDTWTPTTPAGAPTARGGHTAVWTGTQMIVWGGLDGTGVVATGGRYTPGSDSWTPTDTGGAPEARYFHTAVWTGTQMIVWGGLAAAPLNSGGRYTPTSNTWAGTSKGGNDAPTPRRGHSSVWTGSEMIIWGGVDGSSTDVGDGSRYDPGSNTWLPTSFIDEPSPRSNHTAVWTGSEMIIWGGTNGDTTGGRYNPVANTWTATTTVNAPSARSHHSAVWTGSGMILWGGAGGGALLHDSGARYNPVADTWTPTAASGRPPARWVHTAVWTGSEMIVWGGTADAATLSSGGRYNPVANTWTQTTENAAPAARSGHTAVWTGNEMIVWGGVGALLYELGTGARYSPATNSWRTTTNAGAPAPRGGHSAVWTGSRMIVFGGRMNTDVLNSSSAYEPVIDDWDALPLAATAREFHTAVWTGTEMIVWGGVSNSQVLQSGGRYDPVG